jgi:hypothetical protein
MSKQFLPGRRVSAHRVGWLQSAAVVSFGVGGW